MYKNLIVSYNEINDLKNAQIYMDKIYKAYKSNKLPKNYNNIDQYYNFSYFKWNDKKCVGI